MEIPSLQHTWTLKDNMFMGSFRKTKYCPLGESQTKTWNKGGSHQFAKRIRDQIVLLSLGVFCLCRLCPCSVQCINQKYHCLQSNQWQTVSESYARDGWWMFWWLHALDQNVLNASTLQPSDWGNKHLPVFWWTVNQSAYPPNLWIFVYI